MYHYLKLILRNILIGIVFLTSSLPIFAYNTPNQSQFAQNELNFLTALESKYPTTNGYPMSRPSMSNPPNMGDQ
jgi:hypothetical protein